MYRESVEQYYDRTVMRKVLSLFLLIVATSLTSCSPQQSSPEPAKKNTEADADGSKKGDKDKQVQSGTDKKGSVSTDKDGLNNSSSNSIGDNRVDLIVVSAIGDENPDEAQNHKNAISNIVLGLVRKYEKMDTRLLLIASRTGAISGVGNSIESDLLTNKNFLQLDFELAPAAAFLGTLVAGCEESASNLDSTHAAGTIKVCNTSLDVPSHSWTWTVESLRGKAKDFLRAKSKRVYVMISSNEITFVSAKEFFDIASNQNGGQNPKVFAIAPMDINDSCNSRNRRAQKIEELAKLGSGKVFSFCKSDWTTITKSLIDSN